MVTNLWLILLISHIFSKHQQTHIYDDFLKFAGTKNQWRRHLTPIEVYIGRKNFRRIVEWDRSPYLTQPKNQKKIKKEKKNSRPRLRFAMSKEGWRGAELIFLISKFVHTYATVASSNHLTNNAVQFALDRQRIEHFSYYDTIVRQSQNIIFV